MHDPLPVWHVCGTRTAGTPTRPVLDSGRWLCDLVFRAGAGEGNRTLMTSLEGWGSAIELRPRARREACFAAGVSTASVPAT
jgi:hypothetical protein